jgi:hypothetical protein
MVQSNAAEGLRAATFSLFCETHELRKSGHWQRRPEVPARPAASSFQGFPIERGTGIAGLLVRGTAGLLLARLALQKLDVHVGSVDADEFATAIRKPR